jgi:ATP-dependent Clp protease ATP-binding subunit ClpA
MLGFVRNKVVAVRTLAALCEAAEAEARREGKGQPGAEHFVLAALSSPDGRAARALATLGASEVQLRQAISRQYSEPLQALGLLAVTAPEPLSETPHPGVYQAAPSGRALIQALSRDRSAPLTSERVLIAAAELSEGVFPRALALLGLQPAQLRTAAQNLPAA